MCGIAGFIGEINSREEKLNRMLKAIIHRGPDAQGMWHDSSNGISLGHRRLSIRDLSSLGAQPMISSDERWIIVYNGEIYNVDDICRHLKNKNVSLTLRGSSDTEVLVESISHIGLKETLTIAKGMFAGAVYDRKDKKILLFRDRFGEKPLYYGLQNNLFVFLSDLISICELSEFKLEINRNILPFYFSHGYIPKEESIYKDIVKVRPGTIVEYDLNSKSILEYEFWSVKECAISGFQNKYTGTFEEASKELESLLINSLKSQLVSDVPVGMCLSGGIDSTLMTSLLQNNIDKKVNTFTIGIENSKLDEANVAKEVAKLLGTSHHEYYVTEEQMKEIIPALPSMYSEPFADSSQIPTYFVSKLAKKDVTVLLSGDAGDELFCGYPIYWECEGQYNKIKKIPEGLRKPCGYIAKNTVGRFDDTIYKAGNRITAISPADLMMKRKYSSFIQENLAGTNNVTGYGKYDEIWNIPSLDVKTKLMLLSASSYLTDDILVKVDRAGMAVSLENRVPMLDKDVVEFAWRLPIEYKYRGESKYILRNILYKYIPKELMERPKQGFSVPISDWLKNDKELNEWAKTLIFDSIKADEYYDYNCSKSLWNDFTKNGKWNQTIWYILMFEAWKKQYKEL